MNLEEALKLPPIPLRGPNYPEPSECSVVSMDDMAITDSSSRRPAIANVFSSTCTAIFIFDPVKKRLGVIHTARLNELAVEYLILLVRGDDKSRQLDVTLVGGVGGEMGKSTISRREAEKIIEYLSQPKLNLNIKHADLFDKNRSEEHIMDSRTGEFFYVENDLGIKRGIARQMLEVKRSNAGSEKITVSDVDLVYDGVDAKHQKSLRALTAGNNDHTR